MFSLIVGHSSRWQFLLGLLLAATGVAICFAHAEYPDFLGFRLGRFVTLLLMVLLGALIGWPVRVSGYTKRVGLTLAVILGSIAFVLLVTKHILPAGIICLLAQMEWVGAGSKPESLKGLFNPTPKP